MGAAVLQLQQLRELSTLCTSYVIGLSVVDGLVVEDPAKLLGASTPPEKLLVARAKNAEDLSNSEAP